MILYINNEHCTSVDQLKGYFTDNLTPDSDIYIDLIDYGRHGDIAEWLRQEGEPELASKMESIPTSLSDSSFYVHMKAVITGVKDTGPIKPSFDRCFQFEDLICDLKETEANVSVRLKVLMSVNEEYVLSVSTNWGTRAMTVNPYSYTEGKSANFDFSFYKRSGIDLGEIAVLADWNELSRLTKFRRESDEISVGDVTFKMVHVDGGSIEMHATYHVTLGRYYIGETPVTQRLWKAVMGNNPSSFWSWRDELPVHNVSWKDCQKFIEKLNQMTGRKFRMPTEAEWVFAARGGIKSKGYNFSGSNNPSEVAWYAANSYGKPHHVKEKKPNELGIYGMSGNVWEWCEQLGLACGGGWDSGEFCCETSSCAFFGSDRARRDAGFRLALSE